MTEQIHTGQIAGDFSRPAHHVTDYGRDHHHKPTKAIVGVVIMIVLGFALYEFNGKSADIHSSTAPTSQTLAYSNR